MATIVMSADKVIAAAETAIAYIQERRERENEHRIEYTMFTESQPIFFGLIPRKQMTREDAIKLLKSYKLSFFPSYYAWEELKKLEKLLTIAKHGDPVTLNEEDCFLLFK